jgi:hypothetical protein
MPRQRLVTWFAAGEDGVARIQVPEALSFTPSMLPTVSPSAP